MQKGLRRREFLGLTVASVGFSALWEATETDAEALPPASTLPAPTAKMWDYHARPVRFTNPNIHETWNNGAHFAFDGYGGSTRPHSIAHGWFHPGHSSAQKPLFCTVDLASHRPKRRARTSRTSQWAEMVACDLGIEAFKTNEGRREIIRCAKISGCLQRSLGSVQFCLLYAFWDSFRTTGPGGYRGKSINRLPIRFGRPSHRRAVLSENPRRLPASVSRRGTSITIWGIRGFLRGRRTGRCTRPGRMVR